MMYDVIDIFYCLMVLYILNFRRPNIFCHLWKKSYSWQSSDLEEGGLDLTVALKPVSFYISDKKEMLRQCFCIIGEKKLQKMLPDVLKVLHDTLAGSPLYRDIQSFLCSSHFT